MTKTSETIHDSLTRLIAPLKEQLVELDAEIARTEEQLGALRQTKRDVVVVLARLDPTSIPTKEKSVGTAKPKKVSFESVEVVRNWIDERKTELNSNGGFNATALRKRDDYTIGYRQQTMVDVLKHLHDRGYLRLHHTGIAGSRFYQVVG